METVVSLLILAGSLFALLAAIGVIRFRDCYCGLHAATKAGAFGGTLLAIAVGIHLGGVGTWIQVLLLVVLFYTTMPVAAHLIARASQRTGIKPVAGTDTADLEELEENADFQREIL